MQWYTQHAIHYSIVHTISYTEGNDGSDVAELMQYFADSNGYHENFKTVCNRVNFLKETSKGVKSMSNVIEQYAKEYYEERAKDERKTIAAKLLKDATFAVNKIAELTGLSEQEVENLKRTIA